MGALRSNPEYHININSDDQRYFQSVSALACGWQIYMQVYSMSCFYHNTNFIAIFDGNGGPQVAQFCHYILPSMIQQNQLLKLGQIQTGLENIILQLDGYILKNTTKIQQICKKHNIPIEKQGITRAGCSLVICAIMDQNVIIANVGNCKSYVCYSKDPSKAVLISGNHTASNEEDQRRIKKAGGFFLHEKLNGMLSYTRSIGNFHFKSNKALKNFQQLLISTPSIFKLRRQDIHSVVLGSSGLWQRPAHVLQKVSKDLQKNGQHTTKQKIGNLLEQLIAPNSNASYGFQNMGITFIEFKYQQ